MILQTPFITDGVSLTQVPHIMELLLAKLKTSQKLTWSFPFSNLIAIYPQWLSSEKI
jgi:hypothetical protein